MRGGPATIRLQLQRYEAEYFVSRFVPPLTSTCNPLASLKIHGWKANLKPTSRVTERLPFTSAQGPCMPEYLNHKAWSDARTSDCVHMLTNSSQELSQPIPRYIGRAFSSVYQIALNVNLDSSQAAGTFLSQRSGSEGITFVVWSILFPLCLALHTLQSPLTCKRN